MPVSMINASSLKYLADAQKGTRLSTVDWSSVWVERMPQSRDGLLVDRESYLGAHHELQSLVVKIYFKKFKNDGYFLFVVCYVVCNSHPFFSHKPRLLDVKSIATQVQGKK
jgi:hypothetical protein